MKSETLILTGPTVVSRQAVFDIYDLEYAIPYLPAYAIVNHYLEIGKCQDLDGMLQSEQYELLSDKLVLKRQKLHFFDPSPEVRLTIQHAGIADHSKLFPYITETSLRERVGQFASEAEKTFDSGAWASFVIMVGAVIEGMLGSFIKQTDNLYELLKLAAEEGFLTETESKTLDDVRKARNLIHAKRHDSSFIDRARAMQVYAVYYSVVRKDWSKLVKVAHEEN